MRTGGKDKVRFQMSSRSSIRFRPDKLSSSRIFGDTFLKQVGHALKIRVARTELPRKPIASPCHDGLVVKGHVELPLTARFELNIDVETFLDNGRETRSLCLVIFSRRTEMDFDLHNRFRQTSLQI